MILQRLKDSWEARMATRYTIYLYHRVIPYKDHQNRLQLKVTPELFEQHLQYFKANYRVHFVDDLIQQGFKGKSSKDIALTFDDGYLDNYLYAWPLIQKYQIPTTIFITTRFIDEKKLLWWDILQNFISNHQLPEKLDPKTINAECRSMNREQLEHFFQSEIEPYCSLEDESFDEDRAMTWNHIQEMSQSGLVRFEVHTHSHCNMQHLSEEESHLEIQKCQALIEKYTQRKSTVFAYPYGAPHERNDQVLRSLQKNGFKAAFLAYGKTNTKYTDPYSLDRVQKTDPF